LIISKMPLERRILLHGLRAAIPRLALVAIVLALLAAPRRVERVDPALIHK
jgi:hypothetical protein